MRKLMQKVGEVVEIAGKTALSVIPVGGALATAIYDTVKGNALQKRHDKWKTLIEQRLGSLEITLDDLGNNENFATMLIKTTELAMKSQQEEKLIYLANALKNSIDSTVGEDMMIIFMTLIDKYTVAHVKILENQSYDGGRESHALFDKIYNDLFNDGLVKLENRSLNVMRASPIGKNTTSLGDNFLTFLMQKEQK